MNVPLFCAIMREIVKPNVEVNNLPATSENYRSRPKLARFLSDIDCAVVRLPILYGHSILFPKF